ncbi:hypothetical protein GGH94_003795 [Coemansia aciculifera]|uniref:LuxS/MPP-like metallohydrolase n=1 Tax=Coemansia aciculifera TaxID=417176 RepID=A0A9W8ILK8_9FUNG|nr:hypothetical protein GGH94_003795 [Coemansia aciculifera]
MCTVYQAAYFLARTIQENGSAPQLHPVEAFNNYNPADWNTGFESKLTVESSLPYEEYTGTIKKSGNDQRQYRLMTLPNNPTVLCVQDVDAKEAAASLSVSVGSSANAVELQGLAHFLEHMLFLGTEKYPKEEAYRTHLSRNSGKCNAHTAFTETNYHFSVFNDVLEGALDRFALPEHTSTYGERPFAYINALLSHKEPESIYSVLRKNGWATAISTGSSGMNYDGFGTYTIDITATPEGLENYESIVSVVFGYIKMLVENGPQEWYYQELALISKANPSITKMLHLPGRNEFLPESLSVTNPSTPVDTPALEPVLLRKNDKFEVWFKQDDQFFTPHGRIGLTISSESAGNSPVNHLLLTLLCKLVSAKLQEHLFGALLANNYFYMSPGGGSINIGVSGFSSGLSNLLKTALQKLKTFKVDAQQSVQSLISLKQEKLKSIEDEFSQLWAPIKSDKYNFDKVNEDIKHLKQLSKDDLLVFWDKYVNEDTAQGYTGLDMQMWSTKIWQPTAEEF